MDEDDGVVIDVVEGVVTEVVEEVDVPSGFSTICPLKPFLIDTSNGNLP